jgi:hypothetical protein
MEPFNHPKPQMPAHVRERATEYDLLNRALVSAMLGRTQTARQQTEELRQRMAARLAQVLTEEQRLAEDRYNLDVRKYNEAVDAYNEQVRAQRQARVNARQVAQVRKQACPTCFASHPGEC